jgi:hypothetical protein
MAQPNTSPIIVRGNNLLYKMLTSAQTAMSILQRMDRNDSILVSLDPGETTGVAIKYPEPGSSFNIHLSQLETKDVVQGYKAIKEIIPKQTSFPVVLICEDYRVYKHKTESHAWSSVHTVQLIGAIKVLANELEIREPFQHWQMASQAKGFVDDTKLRKWDMYEPGMRHARDAERHLLYFSFFA